MTSFIKIKRYDKFYIVKRRVDVCNKRELINQGKFKLEVSCACHLSKMTNNMLSKRNLKMKQHSFFYIMTDQLPLSIE